MCTFLRYWAGLQAGSARRMVEEGAAIIQDTAVKAHSAAAQGSGPRIEDADIDGSTEP